jgi:uncharacterized membrane protein YhaH (DUF805 family)
MRKLATLAVLLLLGSCTKDAMMERFESPAEQAAARIYIDALRSRDFDRIEQIIDPSIAEPSLHGLLVKMADLIPAGSPKSVKLVGSNRFTTPGSSSLNSTFEYEYGDKWFLINVALKHAGDTQTIIGIGVVPEPDSLEAQNRFTFAGRSPLHYVVLALAIAALLVTLVALVVCVRTKHAGRKWPWILFILVGVCQLSINWTTGQCRFKPFSVVIFSAGAVAPLYGAWMITCGIPFGAIWYLVRRRRYRSVESDAAAAEAKPAT